MKFQVWMQYLDMQEVRIMVDKDDWFDHVLYEVEHDENVLGYKVEKILEGGKDDGEDAED